MTGCVFTYILREAPPLVLVVDHSETYGGPTVTNAAEEVIQHLLRYVPDLAGRRVIYSDSEGRWDELVFSPERGFLGFGPIGATTESAAIEAVSPQD